MWYSGIDQHKQFCVITTYGPDGPRVKQARVASAPLALQQYFAEFPGPHQASGGVHRGLVLACGRPRGARRRAHPRARHPGEGHRRREGQDRPG
jgi:hypothetical protein